MREIYLCFWIDAPVEKVYRAVTDEDGLAGWWTRDLKVTGKKGSISSFWFRSGAFNKMRVVSLSENARVEWLCVDGFEDWIGTHVVFEMRPDEGRTKVCFSHFGWREQTEYVGECNFHWVGYLASLQGYCERGEGSPNEGRGRAV
jgi:uncharacterized protein YndB with AHSA1/START domain